MINTKIKQARNLCLTSYVVTGLQGFPLLFPKTVLERNQAFNQCPLPMGCALQKPRAGGTRYSSQVKDYLKARLFKSKI